MNMLVQIVENGMAALAEENRGSPTTLFKEFVDPLRKISTVNHLPYNPVGFACSRRNL